MSRGPLVPRSPAFGTCAPKAPGGAGWCWVVASPLPQPIVEIGITELLLLNRVTVILAGGVGAPVGTHELTE